MSALLRLVAWLLALALVALPVVAVMRGWIGADQWPLRQLRASGDFERVDPALVQRTLQPYARRGYFAVDLRGAQAAVARLPWVEQAEVRKHWPDTLEVRIVEHRPFARWGRDRLLSMRGRLFRATNQVPAGLPRLGGPDGRVAEVVQLYQQTRELFGPVGLNVRDVVLDPRGSWSVILIDRAQGGRDTQVVVGRAEARARLGRFVRLLPQLRVNPERHIVRADLRYTNGFALTWAAPASKPATAVPAPRPATPVAAPALPRPVASRLRPNSPIPGLS
ncbi:cell division protein FtsQ/DivIB [Lysobacter humi (ex Lee et al. 2017)]